MHKGSWREFGDSTSSPGIQENEFRAVADRLVRIQRTRVGKGGKTVTLITGLELNAAEAKTLLKRLKARCGTGGTLKDDVIELQGDQLLPVMELLKKEGFQPKKSGS